MHFLYTIINSNLIASFVQKKKSFEILWSKKIFFHTYATLKPPPPCTPFIYLPLNKKDTITHKDGLAVYVKEGHPFMWVFSVENSENAYKRFYLGLHHSVTHFFFFHWWPSFPLCTVFDAISSNIDEVLSLCRPVCLYIYLWRFERP